MATVLHLMPSTVWRGLDEREPITSPSLASEGFIHCTDSASVLLQVANAFYRNQTGEFVVVHIDTEGLTSVCVWEAPAHISGSGPAFAPKFPHIYGPIDRNAVTHVQDVVRDAHGQFVGYDSAAQ